MGSGNAARVQGAGPNCTDGDPVQVCPEPGSTWDVNVTGGIPNPLPVSGTVTANQGAPNAGGAQSWPIQGANFVNNPPSVFTVVSGAIFDLFGHVLTYFGGTKFGFDGLVFGGNDPDPLMTAPLLWTDVQTATTQRTPHVFRTAQAAAAGNTALWTPAAGRRFRLMRYMVTVTDNAAQGAAGVLTITLFDGAAGATGQAHDVFVPALALNNNGVLYNSGWITLDNGVLSTALNNVLNINLSAALVTGNVRVICCGTEEF